MGLYIGDPLSADELAARVVGSKAELSKARWWCCRRASICNVLRTHPLAIVGEHLYDNVYFEPAALVLGGADLDRPRVEWMRDRLRSRGRRDKALA